MTFLKLKLAGSSTPALVNAGHIQHVRQLAKGVRIYWGTAMNADEGGSYVDQDDFDITMNDLVELLRVAQVEVL